MYTIVWSGVQEEKKAICRPHLIAHYIDVDSKHKFWLLFSESVRICIYENINFDDYSFVDCISVSELWYLFL